MTEGAMVMLDYRWSDWRVHWFYWVDQRWWYEHLEVMPSWMVVKVEREQ